MKKLYREVSKGKAPVRFFILKMKKQLKRESRHPDLTRLLLPVEYAHMRGVTGTFTAYFALLTGMQHWHIKDREDIYGRPCRYCGKHWKNAAVHLLYNCDGMGKKAQTKDVAGIDRENETFIGEEVRLKAGEIIPGYNARDLWVHASRLYMMWNDLWKMGESAKGRIYCWHGTRDKEPPKTSWGKELAAAKKPRRRKKKWNGKGRRNKGN